jgi:hypothetical protein
VWGFHRANPPGSGSVVTWRRAQMVPLSAQGMDVHAITGVAFTSEDRVRDLIRKFNADGSTIWSAVLACGTTGHHR